MITTKEIIQSITSISTYFKTLFFLGFIWLVSLVISKTIEIPINYVWFTVVFILALIGTYLATSPLFIDYKYVLGKLSETARISIAELKKEQANCNAILADFKMLEAIYDNLQAKFDNLQANEKQNKQIISELQNELSEYKASDSLELATCKQELNKAKQYLESMSKELLAKTTKLNSLQQAEKFMFLVELGITKQQVKDKLVNTVNGLMNGKTEEQKENIRKIFNS